MRYASFTLAALALALVAPPSVAANIYDTGGAYQYENNSTGYSSYGNASSGDCTASMQRVRMEPDNASLPANSYRMGDTYIVNPMEMTNTRDNRGDIPENGAAPYYRIYCPVNNAS